MKCSNCGHDSGKKVKLTLSVDEELVIKAKERGVNLSQLMRDAILNL